ncbi:MAG: hypothetical protein JSS87_11180 [Acidobacteria bacterium]|nr:hypothetical protein [Acidobacteriota bacterium]
MFKLTTRIALLLAAFTLATVAYAQTAVYAQLNTSLDSGSSKVNDTVSAKLRQSIKLPDGTKVPSGALLTGHVTSVKDGENSSLSFVFDKLVFDDTTMPVQVVVRRLDEAPINSEDTDEDSRQIKKDGKPVSKLHNIDLEAPNASDSATVASKGKSVRLEYKTLLGCMITAGA